jgi:16S rRNA (guanine1516-N2)-methyltransferase
MSVLHRAPPAATGRSTPTLVVVPAADDGVLTERAMTLARELGLPCAGADSVAAHLALVVDHEALSLRDLRDARLGPVRVDYRAFLPGRHGTRVSRSQPLARAFGKKVKTIVDVTAGYAQDALLLALTGFTVTAIERHPVVAALARDGLARFAAARGDEPLPLTLLDGDALNLLASLPAPDAIYLDPMFPPKRKASAAVRKEMRLLRALVGDNDDAGRLLDCARAHARERVVVKRPDDATPLAPRPSMSYPGKLVRYDVYLTHRHA